MTIINRKFIAAAAALATVATLATTASACGGRSSGGSKRTVSRAVATFARPAFRTALPRSYGAPTVHRSSVVSQPYVSHAPAVQTYASSANMIHSQPIQTYPAQPSYSVVPSTAVHSSVVNSSVIQSSAPSTSAAPLPVTYSPAPSITPSIPRPAPAQVSSVVATQTVSTTTKPAAASATTHPSGGSPVGKWSVSLPGDQTVSLELRANQTFTWTATKAGQSKSFSGQYRIANDRMTLVRSEDLETMVGDWKANEDGYRFTIDGTVAGDLNFTQA